MTKKTEDEKVLARFCRSIKHEEITLETWESCMTALNLEVPVFLTPSEADSGTDKTVRFCRTILEAGSDKSRKEPANVLVQIPPKATEGMQLKCSGLGDAHCDKRGDLLVIVRIKR
jgi:hypothetical protein